MEPGAHPSRPWKKYLGICPNAKHQSLVEEYNASRGGSRNASDRKDGSTVFSATEVTMALAEKISARIREKKAWDKNAHVSDFQIRVTEKGAVLVNLKTGEAQLIDADGDAVSPDGDIHQ